MFSEISLPSRRLHYFSVSKYYSMIAASICYNYIPNMCVHTVDHTVWENRQKGPAFSWESVFARRERELFLYDSLYSFGYYKQLFKRFTAWRGVWIIFQKRLNPVGQHLKKSWFCLTDVCVWPSVLMSETGGTQKYSIWKQQRLKSNYEQTWQAF